MSGPGFDSAAEAFTAKGQSIIEDGIASHAAVRALTDDRFEVLDSFADLDFEDFAPCFALAEWPAQAFPLTTNACDFAG